MAITEQDLAPGLAAKIAQMGIVLSPNANVIYVDSGHASTGTGKPGSNPRNPLSTIDEAMTAATTAVTASNGDLIVVMPGHTESITNATDLAPDVVGVNILGLGRGSDRPTLTLTATGSNIPISAANIVMSNFLITISGTIDVVAGITVSAADVLLKDIELREAASDDQFVDAIIVTTGAARCEIDGYRFTGIVAGDATQTALLFDAALDGCRITNAWAVGEFATAAIEMTAATTRMFMKDLYLQQEGAADPVLTTHANTTGVLVNAHLANVTADDAGFLAALTAANELHIFNLQITNTKGMMAGAEAIPTAKGWASGPAQIT